MTETIKDRSEILFIYQVKDANPNGDPLEGNAPRTDPETGVATVTDVRIKRWIRDFWKNRKALPIWIDADDRKADATIPQGFERFEKLMKEAGKEPKSIKSKENKSKEKLYEAIEFVKSNWIDIRAFGSVMPTSDKSDKTPTITLTGPVQFSGFNRSFHRVQPMVVQGTAAFASKGGKLERSFREDHILPYACIGVYGVINEIAARTTNMTENDRSLLLEGLWHGLMDMISRSKFGHLPLMLIHIRYKDGYRIGDLAQLVDFKHELDDEKLRNTKDFRIGLDRLKAAIEQAGDKVTAVEFKYDSRLNFDGMKPDELPKSKKLGL